MKLKNRVLAVVLVVVMTVLSAFVPSYSVSSANVNTDMTYYKYDNYGNYLSSYTLSVVSTISTTGSDAEVYSVIGDDERYLDNTKNGVVRIDTSIGSSGTGFVVDEHTIATASHCVYYKANATNSGTGTSGIYITNIVFYDENGTLELSIPTSSIENVHIPNSYITTDGSTNAYDYALITVSEDLSDYMCFNLGIMLDELVDTDTTVYATGFSGGTEKWTGSGNLTLYDDFKIWYDADIVSGGSGGPVYIATAFRGTTYYTVVGIHVTTSGIYNGAIRITTTLLRFFYNNPNL